MTVKPEILLVDDEESILLSLGMFLETKGYAVTTAQEGGQALARLAEGRFPVVISDIYIDRVSGLDVLRAARRANPDGAVILMTARGSLETTVEAEASGVFDYLAKPVDLAHLLQVVERALQSTAKPPSPPEDDVPDTELLGSSPAMVQLYKSIVSAARSESTVLILGETGSGKELVARSIYRGSRRAGKSFVTVDCAAIPENLWESELFGAVRGAFTGADKDRAGVVEQAAEGTIFLDEIGEIPLTFQAKLLRLLQAREFRKVGAAAPQTTDIRLLAATNRRLDEMAAAGKFREDLYHRLNVLRIVVPPLREHRDDIPVLLERFLRRANQRHGKTVRIAAEGAALLRSHSWPGNVRELENCVERLVAMTWPGEATEADVRAALAGPQPAATAERSENLEDVEREHVLEVIRQSGGNVSLAAHRLGIQRRTLYKKLERWKMRKGHSAVPGAQEAEAEPEE